MAGQMPVLASPAEVPNYPVDRPQIGPRAFASTRALTRAELLAAPLRWPRPSRLEENLDLPAGKLADGLRALGSRASARCWSTCRATAARRARSPSCARASR